MMFRLTSCLINRSGHSSSLTCEEVARPLLRLFLLGLLLTALPPTSARAAVVTGGDVVPFDPATWGSWTEVHIGDSAVGTLAVDGGSNVETYYAHLGRWAGSEGTATVSGNGSTWDINGRFYVGHNGKGTLNILNGGAVDVSFLTRVGFRSGSEGTVTVSGIGSTFDTGWSSFHVGRDGKGTLSILDGGLVKSDHVSIGEHGSGSTATVSGSGSAWEAFGMQVGDHSAATLNILDGGQVSVDEATSVNTTGSKIVFDNGLLETECILAGPNGLQGVGTIKTNGWVLDTDVTVSTDTLVHSFAITDPATGKNISIQVDQTGPTLASVGAGYLGTGSLTINSGGLVKSDTGYMGVNYGSNGTATVIGNGSTWEMGWLSVGGYGTGTLSIQDGGIVRGNGDGTLGVYSNSAGTVTVSGNGSTLELNGLFSVGGSGTGTLNIQDGGLVKSNGPGSVSIARASGTTCTATVSGYGSTWEMRGTLRVGDGGTGTLNIQDGALVSVGGISASVGSRSTLAFGIGSGGSGLFDVYGNVTLDGTLAVTLLDGYMPGPGDQFTLIQANGINGLSHVDMMAALPALDGSLYWESDYAQGSPQLTLSVVPEPSTLILLTIGAVGLVAYARRRKR